MSKQEVLRPDQRTEDDFGCHLMYYSFSVIRQLLKCDALPVNQDEQNDETLGQIAILCSPNLFDKVNRWQKIQPVYRRHHLKKKTHRSHTSPIIVWLNKALKPHFLEWFPTVTDQHLWHLRMFSHVGQLHNSEPRAASMLMSINVQSPV